jgi:hypothetical protein
MIKVNTMGAGFGRPTPNFVFPGQLQEEGYGLLELCSSGGKGYV